MAQLENRTALLNKEMILGGVVTEVRESRTKNGKPCGFVRIEDFSGSSQIALFGEPWLKWSNMLKMDNYLFIKAQYVQNRYIPERIDIVLNSVELLQDVKDSVIQNLTIEAPVTSVDKEFIGDLDSLTSSQGNVVLKFVLSDLVSGDNARLVSGNRKIAVTEELIDYLDRRSDISYTFNQ